MIDGDLLTALDAFVREHRRCGELDAPVEPERAWMTRAWGATIVQALPARE